MDFFLDRDKGSIGQMGTCSETLVSSYLSRYLGVSSPFFAAISYLIHVI